MKHRKLKQFEIYKISTEKLIQRDGKIIKVVLITITKREALEHGELVKIQQNQLTSVIQRYCKEQGLPCSDKDLINYIVNITVPTEAKKRGEKEYAAIAKQGFTLNGNKYVRLFSGSGQIRRNTVTFIREDLFEPISNSMLCGLTLEDFGNEFNSAKYNAYSGLAMSGCYILPDALTPKVCIVDDFEQIRPHNIVNHVTEENVNYVTLPDKDFILRDGQQDFEIRDGKAIRKSDGKEFTVHDGIKKNITEEYYDEVEDSPALNSFDGQGLMSPEWAECVALYLGLSYIPSQMIIRAPWVKGMLANVPFHEWFAEHGITEIKDSFGKIRQVANIDCIISKSQFKMHKVYKAKCEPMGINAWDYHVVSMEQNHLHWGVTKFNSYADDDIKAMNYQYLQALQLDNDDIEKLCKPTEDFLRSLNSGNVEEVYNNLMVNAKGYWQTVADDENDIEDSYEKENYTKLFQKVIEANPAFIDDKYIRELILRECQVKFDGAKLGKIFVKGNFQFVVSDPIGQLEYIAQHHCGLDIEVKGVIGAGQVYSNYWLSTEKDINEIVLMRSPLIDRNEISKRRLISENQHYFRYLSSGIVYSIHDLTALQMGGCDFDGDICFSTNNSIILKGCYDYQTAKPLYYKLQSTDLVGAITLENVINADIRGLNSKVGQISNKAGSFYANLRNYAEGTPEYTSLYNSIVALGQVVGQEIDRIKTSIAPFQALEWKTLQGVKRQNRDFEVSQVLNDEEIQGIERHNKLTPDVKPYYLRFNYDYLDKAIKELNRECNKMCKLTLGYNLGELFRRCEQRIADEREMQLYNQYWAAYPVIDTDCIVNHICHYFEDFEKNLKKETIAEGVNMLSDFVSNDFMPDNDVLSKVKFIIDGYRRQKRFLAKNVNFNNDINNKEKRHNVFESQQEINVYYRNEIFDLTEGDLQLAFDYLMAASDDEKTVWGILDDAIIPIIKERTTV